MEFGRLPSVDHIDFRMPDEPSWNERALASARAARPSPGLVGLDLRMGMASWSDPGLVQRLGGTRASALSVHARAMPANELNTTFYGYSKERLESWRDAVPEGFRFCPKLPRSITHDLMLVDAEGEMGRFVEATEALGAARGLTWFALPPSGRSRLISLKGSATRTRERRPPR